MRTDPMDEVVGRVQEALKCSRAGLFECVHGDHKVEASDLRALRAAYQSVREENARMREVLQNLADDDGYCDFVSIARDALSRTGGTE
jgi:hypothetical protein